MGWPAPEYMPTKGFPGSDDWRAQFISLPRMLQPSWLLQACSCWNAIARHRLTRCTETHAKEVDAENLAAARTVTQLERKPRTGKWHLTRSMQRNSLPPAPQPSSGVGILRWKMVHDVVDRKSPLAAHAAAQLTWGYCGGKQNHGFIRDPGSLMLLSCVLQRTKTHADKWRLMQPMWQRTLSLRVLWVQLEAGSIGSGIL